jgi:hypothetical protein
MKKRVLEQVDHSKINYPPFRKDFYIEVPEIAKMTDEEVAAYRKSLEGIRIRVCHHKSPPLKKTVLTFLCDVCRGLGKELPQTSQDFRSMWTQCQNVPYHPFVFIVSIFFFGERLYSNSNLFVCL